MNTKPHSDIKPDSRILEFFPQAWRPFAVLARLDRPIGIWLLLLPGLWAITLAAGGLGGMGVYLWCVSVIFFIGAVIMRGAGCIINDLWDRDLDAKVARTKDRPLASGEITPAQAVLFLAGLLFTAFALLLMLNPAAIVLGFLSLPLIALYPFMKRITWWPQAFLGVTFNFSALVGWAAVTNALEPAGILLYVSAIFWTLGYDTIYAHQDAEDDALAGIKSTALYLQRRARTWITAFYALSWALLAMAVFVQAFSVLDVICIAPAALHLVWQLIRWDANNPQSSLAVFRSNRDYGFLVLAGICLGGII